MNRRGFLCTFARGGGLTLGILLGVVMPATRAARYLGRAPADLLARIRHRTRPLDPAALDRPHDLQG